MEIIEASAKTPALEGNHAVALGMFDGVHQGHKKVIQSAISFAQSNNISSAVITLANHPRELTRGKAPLLLTNLETRLSIFKEMGVAKALVLKFDEELMHTEAIDYLDNYLKRILKASFISTGYDHHFGRERKGSPELLLNWCKKENITLEILNALEDEDGIISSSRIRELVRSGNISLANKLLGHNYKIIGQVIKGDQRGRELGFPTANLEAPSIMAIPANGVYKAKCNLKDLGAENFDSVVNIGTRPSFKDGNEVLIEVHILDFDQNIYGEKLELSFIARLRNEIKFDSVEELKAQIARDIELSK